MRSPAPRAGPGRRADAGSTSVPAPVHRTAARRQVPPAPADRARAARRAGAVAAGIGRGRPLVTWSLLTTSTIPGVDATLATISSRRSRCSPCLAASRRRSHPPTVRWDHRPSSSAARPDAAGPVACRRDGGRNGPVGHHPEVRAWRPPPTRGVADKRRLEPEERVVEPAEQRRRIDVARRQVRGTIGPNPIGGGRARSRCVLPACRSQGRRGPGRRRATAVRIATSWTTFVPTRPVRTAGPGSRVNRERVGRRDRVGSAAPAEPRFGDHHCRRGGSLCRGSPAGPYGRARGAEGHMKD